ncbi:MAG TPA: sorbosone dehydrogenase family protein [Bacteroidales bacterium]|nr:sorbosone dehydrogenase family protein [Bacteroidales bacterium]
MLKIWISTTMILMFIISSCVNGQNDQTVNEPADIKDGKLYLDLIEMPEGFHIETYATGLEDARSMAMGPRGNIFVGNRTEDKVYLLRDTNSDFKADERHVIAEGLNMPNGVAYYQGDLYVAEVNRILRFPDIMEHYNQEPSFEVIYDNYPTDRHHGWKYIDFGPDGKLYVPVGAPCNICESEQPIYATITRMDPDGSNLEIYAEGIRNTVGFTWHPETEELWFTDNGRDRMGDNIPPDELNKAPAKGLHFGYPYCHGNDISDPKLGKGKSCQDYIKPEQELGPHVAALGVIFYTGDMFPKSYKNQILIAEHGSWNRSEKIGYRLMKAGMENGEVQSYQPFAKGWLQGEQVWGRPVDILQLHDGSLLVSDDYGDAIYRITYRK